MASTGSVNRLGEPPARVDKPGAPSASPPRWAPVGLAATGRIAQPRWGWIGTPEQNFGANEQIPEQGQTYLRMRCGRCVSPQTSPTRSGGPGQKWWLGPPPPVSIMSTNEVELGTCQLLVR